MVISLWRIPLGRSFSGEKRIFGREYEQREECRSPGFWRRPRSFPKGLLRMQPKATRIHSGFDFAHQTVRGVADGILTPASLNLVKSSVGRLYRICGVDLHESAQSSKFVRTVALWLFAAPLCCLYLRGELRPPLPLRPTQPHILPSRFRWR